MVNPLDGAILNVNAIFFHFLVSKMNVCVQQAQNVGDSLECDFLSWIIANWFL